MRRLWIYVKRIFTCTVLLTRPVRCITATGWTYNTPVVFFCNVTL